MKRKNNRSETARRMLPAERLAAWRPFRRQTALPTRVHYEKRKSKAKPSRKRVSLLPEDLYLQIKDV
ncbi:hypothetical protein QUW17_15175, partial [Bacteroides gallinaceum]|uniref:hypothetical protein n=1 Tax=Bacteroides gallinaceum TaxID=1462571 RepID=UPI0025A4BE1A